MQKNSLNKVILIGNLGQDPESRFTPQGTAVANLSIATNEAWKDQNGELQERTEWHRVVMYGRMAETANEFMKKKGIYCFFHYYPLHLSTFGKKFSSHRLLNTEKVYNGLVRLPLYPSLKKKELKKIMKETSNFLK